MSRNSPSARRHRALKFLGHLAQYEKFGPLIGPKEEHQPEHRWPSNPCAEVSVASAMPPRYVVHPGWVRSATDGDMHFIAAGHLARLYELAPGEYVVWTERSRFPEEWPHLHPRYDGQYGRPQSFDEALDRLLVETPERAA